MLFDGIFNVPSVVKVNVNMIENKTSTNIVIFFLEWLMDRYRIYPYADSQTHLYTPKLPSPYQYVFFNS